MSVEAAFKVALLWHGDREARNTTALEKGRMRGVAEALRQVGVEAEPAVYADEFAGEVRDQLLRVVGFGHQLINALFPQPPGAAPQPGPRLYYPATRPDFQALKTKMEEEWLPAMQQALDIDTPSLPVIWDADFLYGPKTAAGEDTYVLCEINVSSVYPFPDEALAPLARETYLRLRTSPRTRAV
jgi:hypothetical protein